MRSYSLDTAAAAVVLYERGNAFLDIENESDITFDYHVRIKILDRKAFDEATFEIVLGKNGGAKEKLISIKASTFSNEGVAGKETPLNPKNIFTTTNENYDEVKFTLPDVRVGSILEVVYKTQSPFIQNFHRWDFQKNLPKVHSEFTAKIPANFMYNIALRGSLGLTVNTAVVVPDCYIAGNGGKASCSLLHFEMEDIPAFHKEEYMTAPRNFISSIYFELMSVQNFEGRIKKYTEDWSSVDRFLKNSDYFGKQINKAKNVVGDSVARLTSGVADELEKAKRLDRFIKRHYTWDKTYSKYSEALKKAYESGTGSSADINLSLMAALQEAGLKAYPVLLSTRSHGLPVELYPVLTEFNDVVVAVDIGDKRILMDGTSKQLPFGSLPMECMNGRGRLIDKESAFIDLKPVLKRRTVRSLDLIVEETGSLHGTVTEVNSGYNGVSQRETKASIPDPTEYLQHISKDWGNDAKISDYTVENLSDPDKPLIEKYAITFESDDETAKGTIFLSPFHSGQAKNPFRSATRLYPVDYTATLEVSHIMSMTIPTSFRVDEVPANALLALPNNGGRYSFSSTLNGDKLVLVSSQVMTKAVYSSEEYHYLRELYARMIQINQAQIVLKRK